MTNISDHKWEEDVYDRMTVGQGVDALIAKLSSLSEEGSDRPSYTIIKKGQ